MLLSRDKGKFTLNTEADWLNEASWFIYDIIHRYVQPACVHVE